MRLLFSGAVCAMLAAPVVAQMAGPSLHPNAAPLLGKSAVRVSVHSARELRTVLALSEEVLSCGGAGVGTFDVLATPEALGAIAQAGITHTVIHEDLGRHVDAVMDASAAAGPGDGPAFFTAYRTLAEIEARLDELAAQFPALATLSTIGTSFEGRPIRMLRITGPGSTTGRSAFFINGTQHAREWVTPMTTMYIADQLLENYGTDPQVTTLVNKLDFHIVPVANPDGYVYTHTTSASWRKNRHTPPAGSSCYGVDLNRNWSVGYGNNNGSSPDPCNDTYRGTGPFSEPEAALLKSVIDSLAAQGRLKVHWDVHSNGQMILSPWGYTTDPPPDLPMMNSLGAIIQAGMATVRGTSYPYGQGAIILYISSGAARDYSYGTHDAMSWTMEMDGVSFMPPVSEILPIAQEGYAGLLPLAAYYAQPLQLSSQPPAYVAPNQPAPVTVSIVNTSGQYQAGSGKLHHRVGTSGSFTATALSAAGGNSYQGTLAGAPCNSTIQYYFEAQTAGGETVFFPDGGAAQPLQTTAMLQTVQFQDTFEAAGQWTVQNEGLTSGGFVRADPVGTTNAGQQAQPEDDYTPAPGVSCYVTQNGTPGGAAGAADVDGGPTRLISPTFDLSTAPGATVAYAYWMYSVNGSPDTLRVEVSNNNGTNWTPVVTHSPASGWRTNSFAVQQYVAPTAQVRVRFWTTDNPNDSLTEAAIDDFRVSTVGCPTVCYPDCNTDGTLTVADFGCFQTRFVAGDPYADCNADSQLTVADFGCFQTKFVAGCP